MNPKTKIRETQPHCFIVRLQIHWSLGSFCASRRKRNVVCGLFPGFIFHRFDVWNFNIIWVSLQTRRTRTTQFLCHHRAELDVQLCNRFCCFLCARTFGPLRRCLYIRPSLQWIQLGLWYMACGLGNLTRGYSLGEATFFQSIPSWYRLWVRIHRM